MKGKDFLSVCDLGEGGLTSFVRRALAMKTEGPSNVLAGKTLALLFEKPSLRHRVSLEGAMRKLGGDAIYLSPAEVGLGARESVADVARVLSRYVDIIAARTFSHGTVEELAEWSGVPIINALSEDILRRARELAAGSGAELVLTEEPREAVAGADIVYTDVWTSMGQEAETEARRRAFTGYCVDTQMLSLARPDAIFMHDLPAHRGEEVTDDVMDGPQSVVFDQAENKMHALRALLAGMMGAA